MLKRTTPNAKLMSDLSEVTRTNSALAKYTGDDSGDLKLYKTSDGKRTFLRVCETVPPEATGTGAASYDFTVYEVLPALSAEANPAPAMLTVK